MGTTRRSSQQIRELIIDAAQELFSTLGYSGTSTRDIAERAGVAESVLYRNYHTKAAVFEDSIVAPFRQHLERYADRWEKRAATERSPETLGRDYVETLFDFLNSQRRLGLAMINAYSFESEVRYQLDAPFAEVLDRIERIGVQQAEDSDLHHLDIGVTIRVVAGMVFSQALFKDVFFPHRLRVSKARVVEEMVSLFVYGETRRTQPDTATASTEPSEDPTDPESRTAS